MSIRGLAEVQFAPVAGLWPSGAGLRKSKAEFSAAQLITALAAVVLAVNVGQSRNCHK